MKSFIEAFTLSKVATEREVSMKVEYVPANLKEHVGVRVGKAMNAILRSENLHLYDYILKIDVDVRLHSSNYIEKCLKLGADLVGLGYFMLIRMKPFLKLLNGRWPEVPADDAYIMQAFRAANLRVASLPLGITLERPGGAVGSWRYYYLRGIYDLKIGFDPFHEIYAVIHLIKSRRTFLPIFTLLGYITAILKGEHFYDFGRIAFTESIKQRLKRIIQNFSVLQTLPAGHIL